MCAYVEPFLAERDGCPGTDLLSKIARGEAEGQRLSEAEIMSFVSLMLVAGGETTDKAISNLWWNLLSDADALAEVTADPDAARRGLQRDDAQGRSRAVRGPLRDRRRGVVRPDHPAGARVRVCVASANSDETVFGDPRRFDLLRPDLWLRLEKRMGTHDDDGRTGHLGFGIGKHFCLGYELARTESVMGSRRLLEAMGRPRLARGTQPWPTFKGGFRAVLALPVEFDVVTP